MNPSIIYRVERGTRKPCGTVTFTTWREYDTEAAANDTATQLCQVPGFTSRIVITSGSPGAAGLA